MIISCQSRLVVFVATRSRHQHLNILADRLFGRQAGGIWKGDSENPADAQVDKAPVFRQEAGEIRFLPPYQATSPAI
jgi:hypothetical protein